MTATVSAEPASHGDAPSTGRRLLINVFTGRDTSVVHVTGELDIATRNQLVSASTVGRAPKVVIDLGGVTFMDCSGYGSLVAARRFIRGEGRGLTITGQTGQPARFLDMISEFHKCPLRPAQCHQPNSFHRLSGSLRNNSVAVRIASPSEIDSRSRRIQPVGGSPP